LVCHVEAEKYHQCNVILTNRDIRNVTISQLLLLQRDKTQRRMYISLPL